MKHLLCLCVYSIVYFNNVSSATEDPISKCEQINTWYCPRETHCITLDNATSITNIAPNCDEIFKYIPLQVPGFDLLISLGTSNNQSKHSPLDSFGNLKNVKIFQVSVCKGNYKYGKCFIQAQLEKETNIAEVFSLCTK